VEVLHDDAEQPALLVQHDDACPGLLGARAHRLRAGRQAACRCYRCTGTGRRRKGCGNMALMEVADAVVNEIMATTFGVPVKRLTLIKGLGHQDELEEISHRIRELDPDVMTGGQYGAGPVRLRAGRDRLKALPAEPGRWDEQLTGELYAGICQALPAWERGAWLTSDGFVIYPRRRKSA
jgi:hypothetical protein